MKRTGSFFRTEGPGSFLPNRFCKRLNERIPSGPQARISPSMASPVGKCGERFNNSGKDSPTDSSPRVHNIPPFSSFKNWQRIPSHFHSAHQSFKSPKELGSSCKGLAKQNGKGRHHESSGLSSPTICSNFRIPGSQSPEIR